MGDNQLNPTLTTHSLSTYRQSARNLDVRSRYHGVTVFRGHLETAAGFPALSRGTRGGTLSTLDSDQVAADSNHLRLTWVDGIEIF
jgi:hypothetical protein